MIIDFRSQDPAIKMASCVFMGWHCFLDGVEIQCAHYIDDELGVVKSYDVLGDRKAHTIAELKACGVMVAPHSEELNSCIASITLRGRVELTPPDDSFEITNWS